MKRAAALPERKNQTQYPSLNPQLTLSNVSSDIKKHQLEAQFRQLAQMASVSQPESIQIIEALKMAYVVFPSIPAASKVYHVRMITTSLDAEWRAFDEGK